MTTKNVQARLSYDLKDCDRSRLAEDITFATFVATPGLADLADSIGMSTDTISSWRQSRRTPTRESLAVLADEIRSRGETLLALASMLATTAEDELEYQIRRLSQVVWRDLRELDGADANFKNWLASWRKENPDASIQQGALTWLRARAEELAASVTSVALDRTGPRPSLQLYSGEDQIGKRSFGGVDGKELSEPELEDGVVRLFRNGDLFYETELMNMFAPSL